MATTNWKDKSWADLELFGEGAANSSLYKGAGPLDAKAVVEKYEYLEGFVAKNIVYEGMVVYVKDQQKHYTYKNSQWVEFGAGSAGAQANVQSDWNVTDTSSDAYIKNKPTIPTKTSELTNDSGFKTVDTNTTYDLSAPASKTNGNVTINLTAGGSGSGTDSVTIKGTGATTVTTDANGVITINSTQSSSSSSVSAITSAEINTICSTYLGV